MFDYDLAVIGSGPAGEKAAAQAAYFGKHVAVIEKEARVGGACVNTGTIPSKTLRETALYLSGFHQRELYGISLQMKTGVSVPDFLGRLEPICVSEIDRIHKNLGRHAIDLIPGAARFLDEHTLEISGAKPTRRLTADAVLIATGSTPYHPSHIAFADPDIDDSDTILKLDRIPKSMVILGAGVIGCEYASIFAPLGVQVTLVEARDKLLPFLDLEIADLLTQRLQQIGVRLIFQAEAKEVVRSGNLIRTVLSTGESLETEKLLYAAGRSGNTAGLDLPAIGAIADPKRGTVRVDEHYRLAGVAGGRVYAAGDVIGFPALASTSMEQGRVAVCHAFGISYKQKVSEHLPFGIYTIPEVSMIGDTEQGAAAKNIDYAVGRARYCDNARGQICGDLDGMLKLIFRVDDKRLLGVHIVGERATELVHCGQMVIHYGGTIDDFIYEVFNYPTLSEMYKYAAYDGLGNLARRQALLSREWWLMRIVIVGAGAVGVVLGVSLEHAKNEVTYLVRPGRKKTMKQLLLVHASSNETRCRERPVVAEVGDQLPPFEWAILAVRGDQVEEAMALVNQHLPATCTVGVASAVESLDRMRELHPHGPVFAIAPLFAAWSEEPLVWRWFMPPLVKSMASGEGDPKADEAATQFAVACTACGLPTKAIPSLRRSFATPFAAGMALLAGWELAGWDLSALASDGALRKLTASAMSEAARIAGQETGSLGARLLARAPGPALALLLAAMPRLVPKNAAAMWRTHGPKIRLQTRSHLDALLAHADPSAVVRLAELRRRLPSVESDPTSALAPATIPV